MRRLCLSVACLIAATAAWAGEPAYDTRVIGAGTFTFTQPRALRAGPDGSVYVLEGESDWTTARRILPGLASSRRFNARVMTPDNAPVKWFHPAGLHVTTSGDLLVADTGRRRILRLAADGEFKSVLVRPGAPANLEGPTDAVEMPSGEIVVCDSASSRILLFDAGGKFARVIAGPGTGPNDVNHPFSLALDRDGHLWVVDTLNRRLVERSPPAAGLDVKRVLRPRTDDGPLFLWPSYLDVDRWGNLLLADDGRGCVFKLSPTGQVVARLGMRDDERRPLARVSGVAALPDGAVLVSDLARSVLVRFGADGKILDEIGFSHFRGQGGALVGAGVDRCGGFFLVSAARLCRVLYGGPDGVLRAEFGGEGTEPGKLLRPRSAAAGPDGCLYVADSERHDVSVFRSDGTLVRVFGHEGSGPADVRYPRAIAVASDGLVYVGDAGNRRVQVFGPTGGFVRTFARGVNPYALDVDPDGRVAVFDDADEFVATFDRAGREVSRVDVREIQSFGGMVLGPEGKVWMLDRRRGTVKSFSPHDERGGDVLLRDARLAWGSILVRGADGRPFVVSPGGVWPVEGGRLGAFVEARYPAEPGKLLQPGSLALVWDDALAVLERPTGAIQVFGRDGTFRRVLQTTPVLRGIARVGAASNGDLLVLSSLDGVVYRVSKDGRAADVLRSELLRGAVGVAMLPDGGAWVEQDARSGLVLVGADGKERGRLPPAGDRRSRRWGRCFSATPNGDVIVAGQSDGRVACYGQDLRLRWEMDAEKLDEPARLRGIAATCADAAGRLYVLGGDWTGVRIFGPDRTFLAAVRPDASAGSLSGPSDLAIDADGSIFIADTGNNRVVRLTRNAAGGP